MFAAAPDVLGQKVPGATALVILNWTAASGRICFTAMINRHFAPFHATGRNDLVQSGSRQQLTVTANDRDHQNVLGIGCTAQSGPWFFRSRRFRHCRCRFCYSGAFFIQTQLGTAEQGFVRFGWQLSGRQPLQWIVLNTLARRRFWLFIQ